MKPKGAFKPFKAPTKFACPTKSKPAKDSSESNVSGDESPTKRDDHLETYEVYYTKHINQKIKTWEEGLFTYNTKNFKAILYNDMLKTENIDSKYMRIKPDFSPDEEFRTNKFLVQIVKQRLDPLVE